MILLLICCAIMQLGKYSDGVNRNCVNTGSVIFAAHLMMKELTAAYVAAV